MSCRRTFLMSLIIVIILLASDARALIWSQIKFTDQAPSWLLDIVEQHYTKRLERARDKHPSQPVDILFGRSRLSKDWNPNYINIYLRGNPEFCTEEGCLLALLHKDEQGNWQSSLEVQSNGYLMVTDYMENGRMILITETNTSCVNLVWNGTVYEQHPRKGPCVDRTKYALRSTIDNVNAAFNESRIRGIPQIADDTTVKMSVRLKDQFAAKVLLSEIAQKSGATLETDGDVFRLVHDFSNLPRFFVLE